MLKYVNHNILNLENTPLWAQRHLISSEKILLNRRYSNYDYKSLYIKMCKYLGANVLTDTVFASICMCVCVLFVCLLLFFMEKLSSPNKLFLFMVFEYFSKHRYYKTWYRILNRSSIKSFFP